MDDGHVRVRWELARPVTVGIGCVIRETMFPPTRCTFPPQLRRGLSKSLFAMIRKFGFCAADMADMSDGRGGEGEREWTDRPTDSCMPRVHFPSGPSSKVSGGGRPRRRWAATSSWAPSLFFLI